MSIKMKRNRSKNFTEREEAVLLALVKANQFVIGNKKANGVTWKQKGEAWENIAFVFGRKTGIHRSTQALKAKYEGLKKKIRGDLDKEKTGDESQNSTCFSDYSEAHDDNPLSIIDLADQQMITSNSEYDHSNVNEHLHMEAAQGHSTVREPEHQGWSIPFEKQAMLLAKQTYYQQENMRAQERHLAEMELLKIKREREIKAMELLQLEIAEKQRAIRDD